VRCSIDCGASWGEDGTIITTLNSISGIGPVPCSGFGRSATSAHEARRYRRFEPSLAADPARRPSRAVYRQSNRWDWDNAAIDVLSLKTGKLGKVKVVERGGYFARYVPTSSRSGMLVYLHQGTLFGVPFDPERLERGARRRRCWKT